MTERDYILNKWDKHFAGLRDRKLVIYGIGRSTETILKNYPNDNIIGLMDGARSDGSIYGKPIITMDMALAAGVEAVIIIARAGNVDIIFQRIAAACIANSVEVYHISGKLVKNRTVKEKSFEKYADISESALKDKIMKADVVSFDVFDTLVMRRVLYPRDIFKLAGREHGAYFETARIDAEMDLYREGKHPNIYDIYNRMGDNVSPDIEIKLESEYLIRRDSIAAMLEFARNNGKDVYLVSDMYLPGKTIKNMLDNLGIQVSIDNILISCDNRASKSSGLFKTLRSKVGAKRILHIGDNYESDIESAARYGIDDTFHIYSALSMLKDGYASELMEYDNTLPNRLMIGDFISKCLNDPFLFSKTHGKFYFDGICQAAYSLFAPLIYCFFGWLVKKAGELQLERILLSSRDGHIIERIYELLKSRGEDLPLMQYFYTSRAVASLASIRNDDDIIRTSHMAYEGSVESMLKQRFNLSDSEIQDRNGLDEDDEYVLLHRDAILRQAADAQRSYLAYIRSLNIPADANIGLFDFVSTGTCLRALRSFVDYEMTGLYFAKGGKDTGIKPDIAFDSMYGSLSMFASLYEGTYNIFKYYIFMENTLSSSEPILVGFDENGRPVFADELRSDRQLQDLNKIHKAILEYVNNSRIEMHDLCDVNPSLPDFLLALLDSYYSQIETDYFSSYELADEFCNRKFGLSDTAARGVVTHKHVLFYGAGIYATRILGHNPVIKLSPPPPAMDNAVCFIDADPDKQGGYHYGLPVLSPATALDIYTDADIYITLDETLRPGIKQEVSDFLIKSGVYHKRIINGYRLSCHRLESFIVCGHHEGAFFGKSGDNCGCHSLKSCCSDYGRNNVAVVPIGKDLVKAFNMFIQLRDTTIDKLNTGEPTRCDGCPELAKMPVKNKLVFSIVIYNELGICNGRCMYCNHEERAGRDTSGDVDFAHFMKLVNEYGFDKERGIVEPCSGEITIHPQKERIYETVKDLQVMFLTNGLVYDEFIRRKLEDGSGILNLSIDSGTRETFKKVKGMDAYDKVTGNLRRYAANRKGIVNLKYIVLPGINDNREDIDGFVKLCIELKADAAHIAHNLCLSYEDYDNEQTITAVRYMLEKLREHAICFEMYSKDILAELID